MAGWVVASCGWSLPFLILRCVVDVLPLWRRSFDNFVGRDNGSSTNHHGAKRPPTEP
jgi:hypothetical protein